MKIINRKLWTGLLVLSAVTSVTSAAIVGGIEWALASLGVMGLISMTCIGICIAINVSRYSGKLRENERLKYDSPPAANSDGNTFKVADHNSSVKAAIISEEDKSLIIKHIDELFIKDPEQNWEIPAEATTISKEDKRLIMKHIDELYTEGLEESQEAPVDLSPVSEKDKKLIMAHIDELFKTGWEQSESKLS